MSGILPDEAMMLTNADKIIHVHHVICTREKLNGSGLAELESFNKQDLFAISKIIPAKTTETIKYISCGFIVLFLRLLFFGFSAYSFIIIFRYYSGFTVPFGETNVACIQMNISRVFPLFMRGKTLYLGEAFRSA